MTVGVPVMPILSVFLGNTSETFVKKMKRMKSQQDGCMTMRVSLGLG